jgi:ABC-2 type transport system ATP-binding protein
MKTPYDVRSNAIAVAGLRKSYGKTHALQGVDLTVAAGTVCGLLGPNGAGKTTAVRILATLVAPDAGQALVAGYDVVRQPDEVRRRIGYTGQHAALDEGLTGRENLRLLGRLHHLGAREAARRTDELLTGFGLIEAADRLVRTYSGGMRRRLDLVASLLTRPSVLFLDEPSTGLDPRSRSEIWSAVRRLAEEGTTVLLTTQYLDEADRLCAQIAVVDRGTVIAGGSPAQLKERVGARIDVVLADAALLATAARVLADLASAEPEIEAAENRLSVRTADGSRLGLPRLVRELDRAGVEALDVALRRPTLDEVFLSLTGSSA